MSHPVGPAVPPKTAVLPLGRTGRTTASPPVPSGALGSLPAGPHRPPGRLGTLATAQQATSHSHINLMLLDNPFRKVINKRLVRLQPAKSIIMSRGKDGVHHTPDKTTATSYLAPAYLRDWAPKYSSHRPALRVSPRSIRSSVEAPKSRKTSTSKSCRGKGTCSFPRNTNPITVFVSSPMSRLAGGEGEGFRTLAMNKYTDKCLLRALVCIQSGSLLSISFLPADTQCHTRDMRGHLPFPFNRLAGLPLVPQPSPAMPNPNLSTKLSVHSGWDT